MIMHSKKKSKKKLFFTALIVVIVLFAGINKICHSFSSAEEDARICVENGEYHKAAKLYQKAVFYKKAANLFKTKNEKYSEQNDLLQEIVDCYSESGDIKRALGAYNRLYSNLSKSVSDEASRKYIKLQIACCYADLGYFNKAVPIFEQLVKWYPQYLAQAYINTRNFEKAKNVLFSDDVQTKLQNGDDVDTAFLNYILLEYYKETGQFDKAQNDYAPEAPSFESEMMKDIHFADLYYQTGNYQKSAEYYEKLIYNPEFSQKIQNKMKIKYALTLAKTGDFTKAENLINEIFETLKESYELSPEIICTKYYSAKILPKENSEMLKEAQNLFTQLRLTKNSRFYGNIEEFCKVNTQY